VAVLTLATLKSRVAAGKVPPVLVVVGDDEQEKEHVVSLLTGLIDADLQPFNLQRFHAIETEPSVVVASARTLPMLGDRRLVLFMRVERLFKRGRKATDEDGLADEDEDGGGAVEALERYVAEPEPLTVLALVGADVNRGTRLGRLLVKHAAFVECWGLKPGKDARGGAIPAALAKAAALARDRAREAGMSIGEDALVPLLDHCGLNISVLRGDLDKLLLYCAGRKSITRADVAQVVGGATSIDGWAMARAVERGSAKAALRELGLALDAGASPYMVLGQLAWVVRTNMPRFARARVADATDAVFRTDLAMKSSGGEPRVLLERLVVELCGPARGASARGQLRQPARQP
jgi:DNA polymerase-3 subunit delta